MQLWNITEPTSPKQLDYKVSGGQLQLSVNETSGQYVLASSGDYLTPDYIGQIGNQNLHGITGSNVLYITHRNFRSVADKLATYRASVSDLTTKVVEVDQIYIL